MHTTNELITPERAIRNAIGSLNLERQQNARKQSPNRDEVDTWIGNEIEALELALVHLSEYRNLKTALKIVLQ